MSVTEWKLPSVVTKDTDGLNSWLNQDRVKLADGSYANFAGGKGASPVMLYVKGFGFSVSDIPEGNNIVGIEVNTKRYAQNANVLSDNIFQLLLSGSAVGNNLASAVKYPTSATEANYGGSDNLWGATLTRANIFDSTFGLRFQPINSDTGNVQQGFVDYFKIRIYYTEGSTISFIQSIMRCRFIPSFIGGN